MLQGERCVRSRNGVIQGGISVMLITIGFCLAPVVLAAIFKTLDCLCEADFVLLFDAKFTIFGS